MLGEGAVAVTDKKNIKQKLALASCTLLSQQAGAEAVENDWIFDSSFANYRESDDRVSVNKFVVDVSGTISEGNAVDLMVVFDTMTGSTPTGAVLNSSVTSVTGTSGAGGFTATGQAAALAPFDDTRLAVKVDLTHENSSRMRTTTGANISVENDYTSLGGSANIAIDSKTKQYTQSYGLSFSFDEISQTGGQTPEPMAEVNGAQFFGEGERNAFELMGGLTTVVSPTMLWQNNIWLQKSRGYHTDPYKVVSIASVADVELARVYESRPESRLKKVFYSKWVQKIVDTQTLHISYRYSSDDWDVKSHTIDTTYRWDIGTRQYIQSHLRLFKQSAAEFFTRSIPLNDFLFGNLPTFASADNRLDETDSYTVGIKFGKPVSDNGEVRVSLDKIRWEAEDAVIDITDATLMQLSFKLGFY